MKRKVAIGALLASLIFGGGVVYEVTRPEHITPERRFAELVNARRATQGLRALTIAWAWFDPVEHHSFLMATEGYLWHSKIPNKIIAAGNLWAGEVVGVASSAVDVFNAFMRSPGHRGILMAKRAREIVVGIKVRDGRLWATAIAFEPG